MSEMDCRIEDRDEEGIFRYYTGEHVTVTVIELDDDSAYIERIDVDEEYRGQGIGTAAIAEIGEDFWTLYAAPDNADSARLFGRFGEKVVGEDVGMAAPMECLYYLDQGFGVYEVA